LATVTIRYWAAAREAAGAASESLEAATLADALSAALGSRDRERADRLRRVLARSSFLVDGQPAGARPHAGIRLSEAAVIEVLPPFAGG